MSHVVADGRAYHHFIKSWATICKSNGTQIDKFWMPSFDRDFIKDYEFESKLWKMWQDHDSCSQGADHDSLSYADKVQSDFVMKQCNVDKLKRYIANNDKSSDGLDMNLSSFVVACSFIWVCLIKSLEVRDDDNDYKVFRLGLPIDMRNRNNGIPTTYFGNCVVGVFADVKRSELVAQNGLISAARAIRNCSPNSKIYNKDFGWGFPNKVESLHLHLAPYTVSMTECKDEQGGIQISMELKRTTTGLVATISLAVNKRWLRLQQMKSHRRIPGWAEKRRDRLGREEVVAAGQRRELVRLVEVRSSCWWGVEL
ncbi:hypothetical protein ACFE04_012137 [Oxalis oulophora]